MRWLWTCTTWLLMTLNHTPRGIILFQQLTRYFVHCGIVVEDSFGAHRSAVSRIIARVTSAIYRYRNNYIQFPATQNEITAMKQEFYDIAQFPSVIGAVDGTLVFRAPVEDEHLYVGHKGGHSISILGVCDAKLRFTCVLFQSILDPHMMHIYGITRTCVWSFRG